MNLSKKNNNSKLLEFIKKNDLNIKLIALAVICLAMIIKGIMQQPEIIANKETIAHLNEEIKYEEARQQEVESMKESVDTDEYIEKIAREKLGMIKQNEKIFIDVSANK